MKLVSSKFTLLVVLALVGSIASQDCFTAVKKYWQCKFLTPIMKQIGGKGAYVQDPQFTYDIVSEQFSATQNLTQKYTNFNLAMVFFKMIYTTMKSNKCWKTSFLDTRGKYSPIFLTNNYFTDALKIIREFKSMFATSLADTPGASVAAYWEKWGSAAMPTLRNFCLKYDFTINLYEFYNSTEINCYVEDDDYEEKYYSCVYSTLVKNRVVTYAPSKTQMVTLAKCSIKPLTGCNQTVTRAFSLFDWTNFWPQMTISTKPGRMIPFFDSLRNGAPASTKNFSYVYATWSSSSLKVRAYTGDQVGAGLAACNMTDIILNTTNLFVQGTWTLNAVDSSCSLANVTITTRFSPTRSKTNKFNINNPTFSRHRKYIKDSTSNKNYIFQQFYKLTATNRTEINELQSDVFLAFEKGRIEAFVQKSQLASAIGILVDGFDPMDVAPAAGGRRKREAVDEEACKLECRHSVRRRWTGPDLNDDEDKSAVKAAEQQNDGESWDSFVRNHITAPGRCVEKCLSR